MLTRRTLLATSALLPLLRPLLAQAAEALDDKTERGFVRGTVVLWGDRVEPDAPTFAPDSLTADATARQFGWDAVIAGVLKQPPGEDGVARAVMVVVHPPANADMLPPSARSPEALQGLEGASVLNLEQHDGHWMVTDGGFQTRRITPATLCRISGPAAAQLGDAARGPVAPSTGCLTPWGTALIAEYPAAAHAGFVLEFDPLDPEALPTKRSALGRIARAGIAARLREDGRVEVLMSEQGGRARLFRFVSKDVPSPDNRDVLDAGTLTVGVLRETALDFVPVIGDAAQADGSSFDVPRGLAFLADGGFLLACRGSAGAIPTQSALGDGNPDGRILFFRPQGGDSFAAELALSGGDTGLGGAVVSHPTTLAVAGDGKVWIGADGSGIALAEERLTKISQIYRQPVGSAIGGFAFGPDGSPLFAAIRHPGAVAGASYARPATRWPTLRPDMPPQTVVISLQRN
jgi:secreted PhoX family phosphatase